MHYPKAAPQHYAAIFCIALSTIALQILVSRIFSVTFYYHFAFAGVTLAMLGMTAGALTVYTKPQRFTQLERALADYTARFATLLVLAVLAHACLPGWLGLWVPESVATPRILIGVSIVLGLMLLLAAFIQSGVCITLLLTRFPAEVGRLYAADLCGAALGCLAVIAALKMAGPITVLLVMAVTLAALAWRIAPLRRVQWMTLALLLTCIVQIYTSLGAAPLLRVTWAKEWLQRQPYEYDRWNSYSRVTIEGLGTREPFGWGITMPHKEQVAQRWLWIDAMALTVLSEFDGDVRHIAYLKDDITNLAYHVREMDGVAVIGVGGGRDILSALAFKAGHVTGIELNPAILQAVNGVYGDFTGHLDRRPDVSFVNAEARSYLASHPARYDLIQISLIDTWAATAAGGLTLSENKLYTTDAWDEFWDRLSDHGMLSVSRWYDVNSNTGEYMRLLTMAGKTVRHRLAGADPRQHILAAHTSTNVMTLMLSKSALTASDIKRFNVTCKKLGFIPMMTPHAADSIVSAELASGMAGADYYATLPLDVSPPDDDRPFFFNMVRPLELLAGKTAPVSNLFYSLPVQNNSAVTMLAGLFLLTLAVTALCVGWPMARLYRQHAVSRTVPYMLYFAGIGAGFMLIEISQMQRLMIFLGHPVYGLSVVLFTLLLASGIGSSMPRGRNEALWLRPALLCAVLALTGWYTPEITAQLKQYDTPWRIVASATLMAPMGFFMGMMFPLGVALVRQTQEALLPWYWGINGIASVLASVLAMLVSLQWGISSAFWAGAACYAVCLLLIVLWNKENHKI